MQVLYISTRLEYNAVRILVGKLKMRAVSVMFQ